MKSNNKKFAIISVSDKRNIDKLAKELISQKYIILSTGGTAKFLTAKKIKNIAISDFTEFEEILEGRVKTLHPKIHAGILAKNQSSLSNLKKLDYYLIDMVVVNLYPFENTISKKNCTFENAIENIDIGGPTMLRAAAKNHQRVTVVTEPDDYDKIINELKVSHKVSSQTRLQLAKKVFKKISAYDAKIFEYLDNKDSILKNTFPEILDIRLNKKNQLRYGENPHQKSAIYKIQNSKISGFDYNQIAGKDLSYNNLVDTESALSCVKQFKKPACVIVKHANPCGVSNNLDPIISFKNAYDSDPISAFGGIILPLRLTQLQRLAVF